MTTIQVSRAMTHLLRIARVYRFQPLTMLPLAQGTLDFYEFREQMDKNTKMTDSFWLQTFKLYDADSSGSIDEKEFVERFVKDGHDKPEDSIKFCVRVLRDAREITVIAGSKLLSNPELKASFNRTLCSEIDGVERKSNIARHGAKQMA